MSEHDEQEAIFEYAAYRSNQDDRWRMLHVIPNGQYRKGQRPEAGLSFSKGYPDIGLDVPMGRFHGLRIELKVGNNTLAEEQLWWHMMLRRQGYYAIVCYGAEEAIDEIERYLSMGTRAVPVDEWQPDA